MSGMTLTFIPVDQEIFEPGMVEREEVGRWCFEACLASLLGVPLAAVPAQSAACSGTVYFETLQAFLAPRGLGLFENTGGPHPETLSIATGPSPTEGFKHAVIVDPDGKLVHDPHPRRTGLAGPATVWRFLCAEPVLPLSEEPSQLVHDLAGVDGYEGCRGGACVCNEDEG